MRVALIIVAAIFCLSVLSHSVYAEETDKNVILNMVNKYLDLMMLSPQASIDVATNTIRELASLFDFANLEGDALTKELMIKYNQILEVEAKSPPDAQAKYKEARQAVQDIFFSKYVQSFQRSYIKKSGALQRNDFLVEEINISEEHGNATVKIKGKAGLSTLKVHKSGNRWLIYSVDNPRS